MNDCPMCLAGLPVFELKGIKPGNIRILKTETGRFTPPPMRRAFVPNLCGVDYGTGHDASSLAVMSYDNANGSTKVERVFKLKGPSPEISVGLGVLRLVSGLSAADSDVAEIHKLALRNALRETNSRLEQLQKDRERSVKIAQYEAEVEMYELAQKEYAEAQVPVLLAQFNGGSVEDRVVAATEMAKAVYRSLNPAPVHPFPVKAVDPDAATENALQAQQAAGVDAATKVAQHLLEMGAGKSEHVVEVSGKKIIVIAREAFGEELEVLNEQSKG